MAPGLYRHRYNNSLRTAGNPQLSVSKNMNRQHENVKIPVQSETAHHGTYGRTKISAMPDEKPTKYCKTARVKQQRLAATRAPLLTTDGINKVIVELQKYSFSGVKFPVGRLEWIEQSISGKMIGMDKVLANIHSGL